MKLSAAQKEEPKKPSVAQKEEPKKPSVAQKEEPKKPSVAQKELFCSLKFGHLKEPQAKQFEIAKELIPIFEQGNAEVAPDKWKADQYKHQAYKLATGPCDRLLRTKTVYDASDQYNEWRLLAIRIDGIPDAFNKGILPEWFGFLGLAYGPLLLFDIAMVLHGIFKFTRTESEKDLALGQLLKRRFITTLNKDERLSRMANAAVWFTLNLITLSALAIVSGPVAIWLTIAGFGFDLIHETFLAVNEYRKVKQYLQAVEKELEIKTQELAQVQQEKYVNKATESERIKKINALVNEVNVLHSTKLQLNHKLNSILGSRAFSIFSTVVTLTGFALLFFPPTTIAGIVLTSVGLALLFWEKSL